MTLFHPPTPPDLDRLIELLPALLYAEGLEAKQRIISENRDLLLSDEALSVFDDMLAQVANREQTWDLIEAHQRLLQRCRAVGIERAFAEARAIRVTLAPPRQPSPETVALTKLVLSFLNAETLQEQQRIVTENQDALLSDEMDAIFGVLREEYQGQDGHVQALETYQTLLRRCREVGIEAAFAEIVGTLMQSERTMPPDLDKLIDLVMAFVNAASLEEKQRIVTENEDALLSGQADTVLVNFMARYAGQEEYTQSLEMHRALLRLCRAHGIEAAFARAQDQD